MARANTAKADTTLSNPIGQHARGILDLSGAKLVDPPAFLEEKLLKTHGIFNVEINVFSNRIIVEFDPVLISLDKIRAMIRANNSNYENPLQDLQC